MIFPSDSAFNCRIGIDRRERQGNLRKIVELRIPGLQDEYAKIKKPIRRLSYFIIIQSQVHHCLLSTDHSDQCDHRINVR